MSDIRYFKLQNDGAFVAKIKIIYGGNESADEHGNLVKFQTGEWQSDKYDDICAAAERTVDLKDTGIPQGAQVKLKAVVCGGKDRIGEETYIYRNTGDIKTYRIHGTIFNTKLQSK